MRDLIGIFLAAAIACAGPAAATTIQAASVEARSQAHLGTDVGEDSDSHSLITTPHALAASADILLEDGGLRAYGYTTVDANWLSADAGSIYITWGHDIVAGGGDGGVDLSATNWIYSFTATGNGTFTFVYDVRLLTGQPFANQLITSGGLPTLGSFYSVNAKGEAVIPLVAGETYNFTIGNQSSWGTNYNVTFSAVGNMSWQIAYDSVPGGVPEPANWAMLITGFALVGAAARGRKAAVA